MEKATQNGNGAANGIKRRWKRPKEKKRYTAQEMELIKAGMEALKAIRKQKSRGDFDELLAQERASR